MSKISYGLAQRAVACKGWLWLPGMRLRSLRRYLRIVGCNADGSYRLSWDDPGRPVEGDTYTIEDLAKATPDLRDPATLGCLLYLVRGAWADEGVAAVVASYTFEFGYRWRVVGGHHHGSRFMAMSQQHFQTEDEALVAALEAAP